MTHAKENARGTAELRTAFMLLSDKEQDNALAILRALSFAQTVMSTDVRGKAGDRVYGPRT